MEFSRLGDVTRVWEAMEEDRAAPQAKVGLFLGKYTEYAKTPRLIVNR